MATTTAINNNKLGIFFEKNQKKGKVVSGGSTITQQLAKNLFLSGERSYYRKGQELIITFMLEMCMDKERIFEIYLTRLKRKWNSANEIRICSLFMIEKNTFALNSFSL